LQHARQATSDARWCSGLAKLYAGIKPATLRRYGETDDKTDEVISGLSVAQHVSVAPSIVNNNPKQWIGAGARFRKV
jgi:hypothetical protein